MTLIKDYYHGVWHIQEFCISTAATTETQEVETLPSEGVCKKCRDAWEKRKEGAK